mmetsp:Transcript_50567/g.141619  ORF Transcript_50567/g.141619 Transcript_50567/m.141619 type:complete len:371 (-) Transcript_50567:68-1180(-)|eukprot:CAMPEP_0117513154 /NCGR_PEP_ID=MMETSP0784-20121206/29405_1 /TAXON_ID=39447 /ORGANISM="" /LENGTH=370 /DNA_ID=CAMNT_0005308905 /DNA_START=86 /DNA_END=1198 /DNA_ORIENTATION=+
MEAISQDDALVAVQLLVLGIVQFSASMSHAIARLGAAITFVVGWNLTGLFGLSSGKLVDVAIYGLIRDVTTSPLDVWWLRDDCNYPFAVLVSILWMGCDAVGTQLMIDFGDSDWLKRSLGVMLLLVFLYETSSKCLTAIARRRSQTRDDLKAAREPSYGAASPPARFSLREPANLLKTLLFGPAAGFLQGLYSVPLAALIVFVLYSGMGKQEWRASMPVVVLCCSPLKMYVLFVQNQLWDAQRYPFYIVAALSSVVAVPLGQYVATRISQERFRQIVTIILFFGALMLATTGTGMISTYAIAGLSLCGVLALAMYRKCSPMDRQPAGTGSDVSPSTVGGGSIACNVPADSVGRPAERDDAVAPQLSEWRV